MPKKVFISYSHADARWLERLHKHLAQLRRDGDIEDWYDREITAGGNLDQEIERELKQADIFIAALSPDFIASNYCYEIELQSALAREASGNLVIVPIIFEPCDWLATPLSKFKAVPEDGRPISEFTNENVALLSITSEIRRLTKTTKKDTQNPTIESKNYSQNEISRYRIKKNFDRVDKRDFLNKSFHEIRSFFQSSVSEINSIPEIEAEIIENDRDSFSCSIVNRGLGRAFETITVRKEEVLVI